MYISYVLPVGYSYVFVFISLFPHMFPVCSRLVWKCESQNEFPHWDQFRIRASLRILNSLELRSSWSTKCTLGTGGFSRVRLEFSVLAEGRHIFGRRPKPQAGGERSVEFCREIQVLAGTCSYSSSSVAGYQMSVVNICNKKVYEWAWLFYKKSEENWIYGRLEYVSAITKSSF